jgi:hypothetical protein
MALQEDLVKLANELTSCKQKLAETEEREKYFQSEVLKTKHQIKTMKGKIHLMHLMELLWICIWTFQFEDFDLFRSFIFTVVYLVGNLLLIHLVILHYVLIFLYFILFYLFVILFICYLIFYYFILFLTADIARVTEVSEERDSLKRTVEKTNANYETQISNLKQQLEQTQLKHSGNTNANTANINTNPSTPNKQTAELISFDDNHNNNNSNNSNNNNHQNTNKTTTTQTPNANELRLEELLLAKVN